MYLLWPCQSQVSHSKLCHSWSPGHSWTSHLSLTQVRMFLILRCLTWTRAALPSESPFLQHHPLNCPLLQSIQNTQTTISGEVCVPSYSHLIVTSSFHLFILITCSDWTCLRNLSLHTISICTSVHKITFKWYYLWLLSLKTCYSSLGNMSYKPGPSLGNSGSVEF